MPAAAQGAPASLALVEQMVGVQAAMIAYVADFKFMMLVTLAAIPLILLLRGPKRDAGAAPMPVSE